MKISWILMLACASLAFAADGAADNATSINPLLIGADLPSAQLTNSAGETVDLAEVAGEQPTVLVFYRGNWCPICNRHLQELQPYLADLKAAGYAFYAINQDNAETNSASMKKQKFEFEVLADGEMAAARGLGLAFKVDENTVKQYKQYGIDLVGLYGRAEPEMTVPAVLIVRDGKIRFSYVNPDYRERLDPKVLVTAAQSLAK